MGGDCSAPGGCRQRNTSCLTVTPSAAGRLPPPLRSVSSRLLDLYHECVDNGGWVKVLYGARGGMEKFLFIRKIEPTPAPTAPAPPLKPGRPASDRRGDRDKRRREAWAARRCNHSQPRLHTQATEDDIIARVPAPASTSPLLYRTMWSRCHDVVIGGHVFEIGNLWGKGKGDGEERGGEVSTQATRDQSGRESHHTQSWDSKYISKRGSGTGEGFSRQRGIIKGNCAMYLRYNANLVHIVPIVCMSC